MVPLNKSIFRLLGLRERVYTSLLPVCFQSLAFCMIVPLRIWLAVLALALAASQLRPFGLQRNKSPSFGFIMSSSMEKPASIYDITVKDIKGQDVPLSNYKGKVLLIVNVASQCGFTTNNYKELNELYESYKDKGLEILAFPCNQFAGQEPGTNEEIQQAVCTRFKAEFPVFGKVNVNGADAAPLYKYLKAEKGGGIFGDFIKWNFSKFLVSRTGEVVERYAPTTAPLKIEKDIKNLL